VLVEPDDLVWVDCFVPAGDPLWDADVARAFWGLGEVWGRALAGLGIAATVHRGPLVGGDLARTVCFAGIGAGEVVTPDGRAKLVGISQRRTRAGVRLQSAAVLAWRPDRLLALFPGLTGEERAVLHSAAHPIDHPAAAVVDAFVEALRR
jgi:hypothetical protein